MGNTSPNDATSFVLFGGTGDLAMRKILPALHEAETAGRLPHALRILIVDRSCASRADLMAWLDTCVRPHLAQSGPACAAWTRFVERIEYVRLDFSRPQDFVALRDALRDTSTAHAHATREKPLYYLATGPALFVPICRALAALDLTRDARVVLEKPLGYDLQSSRQINDEVGQIFAEEQIYRIDHYLGKESVQNLLALRFGNTLFEPVWRREWVESVQITIAEQLGVEGRGEFYDSVGALRDMVQNHLLQLLSIVAMEPPHSMDANAVRDEKLRVLRALKPVPANDIDSVAVRGQYDAGVIRREAVPAYAREAGIARASTTETFVALRVEVENWRWAGVPFFLRTGKRLAERAAEIVITFRPVPHSSLGNASGRPGANRLVIRLQPDEDIRLHWLAKRPGEGMALQPVHLEIDFDRFFAPERMDAYQRLLIDAIHGRLALFVHRDEQEAAWRWVEPILRDWKARTAPPRPYLAGSWGPAASSALLARAGMCWMEEEH
ncbi:Glucose-6-phosphate 1-dehydrogenase [Paraburkholderia unamae]|uniref:glucose-6-phosphate dehydrogenase n=1 Tax=Paraburkholderia unamae TaxID=219649 RepID=UPI001CB30186|nr:glucose-6-phosphate dehydrogenase [Paraburkholderia unamae]CAG9261663.1 Glucose-6-phosphate 1-dehydrogenase [Paraburkholderia unamae]